MDETAGRKIAQNMNLPITGNVGILIQALKVGIITVEEAEDAFDRIRKANRYISEQLINKALAMIHDMGEELIFDLYW